MEINALVVETKEKEGVLFGGCILAMGSGSVISGVTVGPGVSSVILISPTDPDKPMRIENAKIELVRR